MIGDAPATASAPASKASYPAFSLPRHLLHLPSSVSISSTWRQRCRFLLLAGLAVALHLVLLGLVRPALRPGEAEPIRVSVRSLPAPQRSPIPPAPAGPAPVGPTAERLRPLPAVPEVHRPAATTGPAPAAPDKPRPQAVPTASTPEAMPADLLIPPPVPAVDPGALPPLDSPRIYPTRLPSETTLVYTLKYRGYEGRAELHWQFKYSKYQLTLRHELLSGRASWRSDSEGRIGNEGLIPERSTEELPGGAKASTQFQPAAGMTAAADPEEARAGLQALPRGLQDRVSWIIQLSAIAGSDPGLAAPGHDIGLLVASAFGPPETWTFRSLEPDTDNPDLPGLPRLLHETTWPQARRVEVWLDPRRDHLPARILLADDLLGWMELNLQAATPKRRP